MLEVCGAGDRVESVGRETSINMEAVAPSTSHMFVHKKAPYETSPSHAGARRQLGNVISNVDLSFRALTVSHRCPGESFRVINKRAHQSTRDLTGEHAKRLHGHSPDVLF